MKKITFPLRPGMKRVTVPASSAVFSSERRELAGRVLATYYPADPQKTLENES